MIDFSKYSMVGIAFLVGIPLLLVAIVDLVWVPFYYRTGIEIYRVSYALPGIADISLSFPHISHALKGSFFHTKIQIHKIGPNEYAFRYNPFVVDWNFKKGSLMHRIIRFYPETGKMMIIGYLNWSVLLVYVFLGLIPGWMWVQTGDWEQFFWALLIVCLLVLVNIVIGYSIDAHANKKLGQSIIRYFRKTDQQKQPRP